MESRHAVIIQPSRGTALKWQFSLRFIYPAVAALCAECVSMATRCCFQLQLCVFLFF